MKGQAAILATGALILAAACQEENLLKQDPNSTTLENFFGLESQFNEALFAGYSVMQGQHLGSRTYYFLNDLRGGEVQTTGAAIGSLPRLSNGSSLPSDGELSQYWRALYEVVHHANTTLGGVERNTTLSDSTLRQIEGEARFLRGWAYNELATHYGGVPLYAAVVGGYSDTQPRSSESESLDFAQDDLQFASETLPVAWSEGLRGRATRGAALAILARSHMQQDDLAAAEEALDALFEIDRYALVDNYGDLFTEENSFLSESIFEIVFAEFGGFDWSQNGQNPASRTVRAQEYGPAWFNVQPTPPLIDAFRNEDCGDSYTDARLAENLIFSGAPIGRGNNTGVFRPRGGYSLDYCGNEGVRPGVYKYGVYYKEAPGGFRLSLHNLIIARLADMYLLKAEIAARSGNDEVARDFINRVRTRVGNPPVGETEFADDLVRAAQHERTVELAFEQIRFRDIKRWRDAGILPPEYEFDYFQPADRVLPIPEQEINANPQLTEADQNDGY